MITCVPGILELDELASVREALAAAAFADGKATAGWHARDVKENLQLTPGMSGYDAPEATVRGALARNATFRIAARPRRLAPILFNRYDQGMTYGEHVDDAFMSVPKGTPMRTDVSFTLFLADPETYDGGELVLSWGDVEQAYKLAPGSLLAYPSGSLHKVTPVTRGSRVAAVGWVESEVRDPARRTVLFDLDRARQRVFAKDGKSDVFDLLAKTHANLLRMWAETGSR
jgi:PKHD-type hydroxylase